MNKRMAWTGTAVVLAAFLSAATPVAANQAHETRRSGVESLAGVVVEWWSDLVMEMGWRSDVDFQPGNAPGTAGSEDGAPACKPGTTAQSCAIDPNG